MIGHNLRVGFGRLWLFVDDLWFWLWLFDIHGLLHHHRRHGGDGLRFWLGCRLLILKQNIIALWQSHLGDFRRAEAEPHHRTELCKLRRKTHDTAFSNVFSAECCAIDTLIQAMTFTAMELPIAAYLLVSGH